MMRRAATLAGIAALAVGVLGPGPASAGGPGGLIYNGGQVLHHNRTHAIFWQPAGSGLAFPAGYTALIRTFLRGVAHDSHLPGNVYSVSGQYYDTGGRAVYASQFAGAVTATDPLPPTRCTEPTTDGPGWTVCLTDEELQHEIEHVVRADHLSRGPDDIYFLFTPDGLGSCVGAGPVDCALAGTNAGSYCGYHSVTDNVELLYAVIPYNALAGHCQSAEPRPNGNPADPTLSTLSHEQNETVTDPYGDAWISASGSEEADLCIHAFGRALGGAGALAYNQVIDGGHYWLQSEWSNWTHSCVARAQPDRVRFSTTGPRRAGEPIAFAAHAVAAHGVITGYAWSFGAHHHATGAHPKPVLTRPGRYSVTVRSTDSAGLWAFATRRITVRRAVPSRRR